MKTRHRLKCDAAQFDEIMTGQRRFELRNDDRNFSVGDILELHRWDPEKQWETGKTCQVRVLSLLRLSECTIPQLREFPWVVIMSISAPVGVRLLS